MTTKLPDPIDCFRRVRRTRGRLSNSEKSVPICIRTKLVDSDPLLGLKRMLTQQMCDNSLSLLRTKIGQQHLPPEAALGATVFVPRRDCRAVQLMCKLGIRLPGIAVQHKTNKRHRIASFQRFFQQRAATEGASAAPMVKSSKRYVLCIKKLPPTCLRSLGPVLDRHYYCPNIDVFTHELQANGKNFEDGS